MTAAARPLVVPAVLESLAGAKSLLIDGHWVQAASGRMNDANAEAFDPSVVQWEAELRCVSP